MAQALRLILRYIPLTHLNLIENLQYQWQN